MDPPRELQTFSGQPLQNKLAVSERVITDEYNRDRIDLARAGKQQVLKVRYSPHQNFVVDS